MPNSLVTLIAIMLIANYTYALITGKVVAGSKGLRTNFYKRHESPFAFYSFIVLYAAIALFLQGQM